MLFGSPTVHIGDLSTIIIKLKIYIYNEGCPLETHSMDVS
jgi:hypothetical protein